MLLRQAADDCRRARLAIGATQQQVADALGCSRQRITAIEAHRFADTGVVALSRYAAVVGLDLSLRTYPAAPLLHDIGQVRLLERFRNLIGPGWIWRTESPYRTIRAIGVPSMR
jgi:DNA-binding XRE family transcriptional regulator